MHDPSDFDDTILPNYSDSIESEFERLNNPNPLLVSPFEDSLERKLSRVEIGIETEGLVDEIAGNKVLPLCLPGIHLEEPEPVRGMRSPDPRKPEDSWRGVYQPPLPGFGRIGGKAGTRRGSEDVYCFREHEYKKEAACKECEHWEDSHCTYSEEETSEEERD